MSELTTTRSSLLVRLCDPQDEQAWAEFVEIYGPLIHRLAKQRGLQDADAADLVQEVFRAVAVAIERFDRNPERGSFRGWLSTIARNLIINWLQAQRRQTPGTGDTEVLQLLHEQPDPAIGESIVFDLEFRRQLLQWAASRVHEEFSEVVWQAFWKTGVEGLPANGVARALGLTVGTVYQYKSRVVARLRREIDRVHGETDGL
jgi:RNA polymerase sigma-70 factor (ECF subfamily)